MTSTVIFITSITSFIGFIINIVVMAIVLWRGKEKHHFLFAPILFIAASWDLGIFLIMIRNSFIGEILLYQNMVTIPLIFLPVFIYHFTTTYLNQPRKKTTILLYAYCILALLATIIGGSVSGVYNYDWGNIARYESNPILLSWLIIYYLSILFSCWLLFQALKRESSSVKRRHITYILTSFIVFCIAQIKILVTLGIDVPFTMPVGMLLVDSFGAIIGIAIVKHRLFDITDIIKKGTVYSILAAVIIFLFSFSEHMIAKYLADYIAGELSEYIHLLSIAIVIIVFMPLKKKLDHAIEGYFVRKKVEF